MGLVKVNHTKRGGYVANITGTIESGQGIVEKDKVDDTTAKEKKQEPRTPR